MSQFTVKIPANQFFHERQLLAVLKIEGDQITFHRVEIPYPEPEDAPPPLGITVTDTARIFDQVG